MIHEFTKNKPVVFGGRVGYRKIYYYHGSYALKSSAKSAATYWRKRGYVIKMTKGKYTRKHGFGTTKTHTVWRLWWNLSKRRRRR